MAKYVCSICGYIYDETAGNPESGIAPGTKWKDVPEDWVCPLCGATKDDFKEEATSSLSIDQHLSTEDETLDEMKELSFGELSALCSNLSKGCEKQYRAEEADLFYQLSQYYKSKSKPIDEKQFEDLNTLIQQDLNSNYAISNKIAAEEADRGALRALAWGEKVTRILNSLLQRYKNQQDSLLENTNVYVCEICGFVYIGNKVPDICPVCKVPNMKLTQIQRRDLDARS